MWCQYPLHHLEECPECAKPVDEELLDRVMFQENMLRVVRTLKLMQMSLNKTRTEKLQGTYPSDGEYQPEIELCDAWGNIIVWEVDKRRWTIVSLTHWEQYKVCYPRWAYLPQTPEIVL
jgi:hypothetical protein